MTDTPLIRALHWFFIHPLTPIGVRALARATGISPPTMLRCLHELVIQKLITKENNGYHAQVQSLHFLAQKQAFNLYSLRTSGLIEDLAHRYKPDAIFVFGSFARGEDHEKSDIDLAIINNREDENGNKMKNTRNLLERTLSLHKVTWKKLSAEMKTSIANGIPVYGTLVLT